MNLPVTMNGFANNGSMTNGSISNGLVTSGVAANAGGTNGTTASEVPPEIVQQIADYFSVLGEPMRLRILNLLRDGEKCVQDLVEATETSQANVSKHLKVMLQAGILTRRTQGTLAYYSVADDLGFQLCTLVCDRLASRIEQQALYFREFSLASHNGGDTTPTPN